MTGKEKCKLLRQIRQEIADSNGIVYITTECTYEGDDCLGTCPKCDQEIAYLDAELNRKIADGEEITISGISLNTFQMNVPTKQPTAGFRRPDDIALGGIFESRHAPVDRTIDEMDFTVRTYNCLKRANITRVSELITKTPSELMQVRNMGRKSLDEIVKKLSELGLSLQNDPEIDGDLHVMVRGQIPEIQPEESTHTTSRAKLDEVTKKLAAMGLALDPDTTEEDVPPPPACGGLTILGEDEDDGEKLCMSIEDLDLSVRSYNCLSRAGIQTVGDLINLTLEDLAKTRNLGKKSMDEIVKKVHDLGFGFLREGIPSYDMGDLF